MNFLRYRKIYFFFSGLLVLASLTCLVAFGLNLGIEFKGGSVLEVEYQGSRPDIDLIRAKLADLDFKDLSIRQVDDQGIILSVGERSINQQICDEVISKMGELGEIKQNPEPVFESISPVIGKELARKTGMIIIFSLLAIILYISFSFRKVSRPIPSWQYGVATLFALFHDVLIPLGVLAILGKFYGVQITIPIITALLTVFGYSVNNTVVIFDRIRENLFKKINFSFGETVNFALNQSLTRSINTSLTTLFALTAIFFFGGETLKYFSLALIMGIISGTYSSMFLVGPALVSWHLWQEKRKG